MKASVRAAGEASLMPDRHGVDETEARSGPGEPVPGDPCPAPAERECCSVVILDSIFSADGARTTLSPLPTCGQSRCVPFSALPAGANDREMPRNWGPDPSRRT